MSFEELVRIVEKLRGPDGCPWDREQTMESLIPFLMEELYELVDAFNKGDYEEMKEELGDLLFQIVLHCQLAKEEGRFDVNDVIRGTTDKMIRRHPHVFGNKGFKTSEEVLEWWKEYKVREGKDSESVLGRTPMSLPALLKAQRIQERASKVGFDWDNISDVLKKLEEEIEEFKGALQRKASRETEDELGDIFFVLVRISNFVGVNPEYALQKTIDKFIKRFSHIEKEASRQGRSLSEMSLEEMDAIWERAKNKDK
jgi:tetrapyrrole methylase family protein/MazG family protein